MQGFTFTKEETGKVAKSEEALAPGLWEMTCSATSPWKRNVSMFINACQLNDIVRRLVDADFVTLSLSRALLRFCSRAVCSIIWAPALTGRERRNMNQTLHTGEESVETETHLLSSRWCPPPWPLNSASEGLPAVGRSCGRCLCSVPLVAWSYLWKLVVVWEGRGEAGRPAGLSSSPPVRNKYS